MTTSSRLHELKELRRVGIRGALLLLPFFFLQLLELFVLPIDFFTFRVWEAALATPYRYPGGFYPNLHIKKEKEYGDGYRSGDRRQVEGKPVEWFIDSYGWRNRPEVEKKEKYDVVVLGDSNIVGSFLDQKDTLTEVLGARSGQTAYSYAYDLDYVSLFFNDPRMTQKAPRLLVVEMKVGNLNRYLGNFRELPDGTIDVFDRSAEFEDFYAPSRNFFLEKIKLRLKKQAMFHWLKASLATEFVVPKRNNSELFVGRPGSMPTVDKSAWRPFNSVGASKPLPGEVQPALAIRATGPNSFWKTERFIASRPDGKIVVRFEAKNSLVPSRHRVYIFEDNSYRSVGEFVAGSDWRTFEIPITTNRGSVLEFQIDQMDDHQWLSLRDIQVIGGGQPTLVTQTPVAIPMSSWTGDGTPCSGGNEGIHDCRQWPVVGKNGYVQTPVLPEPGEGGMVIRFEARTNIPAPTFSSIYLFEGPQYRKVGQYAFSSEWQEFTLLLQPDRTVPTKVQVGFPHAVEYLAIRNFSAIPVEQRH